MSFQVDVLIADLDEAQAIADSDAPSADRDGFTFTGFDRVQLCTLLSLLKSGSLALYDRYRDSIDVVQSSTSDWPVVSVVKSDLVGELAALASLEDAEFEQLAASWAATEEFEGWVESDVRDLLRQLIDLADTAQLQQKCVMIWQSP